MARKRRYDTEALVGQLKAERRTGIILSLAGIGILGSLVALYLSGASDEIPTAPTETTTVDGGTPTGEDPFVDPSEAVAGNPTQPLGEGSAAAGTTPDGEAATETETTAAGETAATGEDTEATPEKNGSTEPSTVRISLNRKSVVWIDDKRLGKFKRKNVKVAPGTHLFRAKAGRKFIEQEIEITGGQKYGVFFDVKKKKVMVKGP